jgi:hypothetical protein
MAFTMDKDYLGVSSQIELTMGAQKSLDGDDDAISAPRGRRMLNPTIHDLALSWGASPDRIEPRVRPWCICLPCELGLPDRPSDEISPPRLFPLLRPSLLMGRPVDLCSR